MYDIKLNKKDVLKHIININFKYSSYDITFFYNYFYQEFINYYTFEVDEILKKLSMLFKIPSIKNKLWICGPYRSGKSYLLGFIEELFGYTITQLPTHFDHHCMQRNLSFNRHIFIITLNNGENDYYPEYISAFPDLIFIIVSNFLPNRNLDETEIITLERKDERNLILPDCKNEDVLAQFASSILNNL